ncbi:MAG: hypothetical protein IIX10_03800 [Clostridia bacterium]|nr:hypothetical protein [Clostridia bacterium]
MKTVSSFRKMILVIPGAVLFYLLQVCVMDYFAVFQVTGNILFAYLAVVIVSCGMKSTFCAAAIIAMLMESMLSSVNGLYALCYTILPFAWGYVFSDMSDRRRERKASLHPDGRQGDLPALLRIVLAAACMSLSMNAVHLVYVYLSGIPLTFGHFGRAVFGVVYSTGLSLLLMVPLRAFLGMYRQTERNMRGGVMF